MFKICLTGGPCGGKSSALSILKQKLENRGYKVVIVPEAATKIISSGFIPGKDADTEEFQRMIISEQVHTENMFEHAIHQSGNEKTVMICDRGVGDNYAYASKKLMQKLLMEHGMTPSDAYTRYDCVLHLRTAALGAREFYQWNDPNSSIEGNNAARFESPDEAVVADQKTLDGWVGHPHLRVIANKTDFSQKIDDVLTEIFTALGEPIPKETERKFLIKYPTTEQILSLGQIHKTNITQIYLKSKDEGTERRVRRRGTLEEGYTYYYTEKTKLASGVRQEIEHIIDKDDYDRLVRNEKDSETNVIEKVRYCFMYDEKYFELDLYPFEQDYAILEVELNDLEEEFQLPNLDIVKEVTNNKSFYNAELAKNLCFAEKGDIKEDEELDR